MSDGNATRVLVVEDNELDQELLSRELRRTPFGDSTLFLSDPRRALELLTGDGAEDFRKNLVAIFLDVHLPYMSGLDVLRSLRELPPWMFR